jgi:preprotein translocase subunit SecG
METFFYVIYAIICVLLIGLILIQQGKGAGVGFSMGGASQAMFGGSGGRDFFIKLTAGLALAFMVICIFLAKVSVSNAGQYNGVMAGAQAPAAPASPLSGAPAGAAPVAPAMPAGQPLKAAVPVAAAPAPAPVAPAPVAPSK